VSLAVVAADDGAERAGPCIGNGGEAERDQFPDVRSHYRLITDVGWVTHQSRCFRFRYAV
jgi:hypothetical protein